MVIVEGSGGRCRHPDPDTESGEGSSAESAFH